VASTRMEMSSEMSVFMGLIVRHGLPGDRKNCGS
jgi:hypothetical protein